MTFSINILFLVAAALPGIVALFSFYANISTAEIKVTPPPLNSIFALSVAGIAALLAHLSYAAILLFAAKIPYKIGLPLADPYVLIGNQTQIVNYTNLGMALLGMVWVIGLGFIIGYIFAAGKWAARDEILFGWVLTIIKKAQPPSYFITAYVITDIQNGKDLLGYEGAVLNLVLDNQKNISGIVLRDVESFYLRMNQQNTKRVPSSTNIATLALTSEDFKNVALDVFEIVEDQTA